MLRKFCHLVAQTHLHKGLKLKHHYMCQATKYCQLYKTSMGIYTRQSLSLGTCAQDPGNKGGVSGSQQDAHEFLALTFLIGGANQKC